MDAPRIISERPDIKPVKRAERPIQPEIFWQKFENSDQYSHHEVVKALFHIIEIKDMKTATHCQAVSRYSRAIGRKVGMSDFDLNILSDAALVHDIGKVMVDNVVIYKRSELRPNERYQMQSHPQKGMDILEGFHMNDSVVDAAWHHHERWDGAGYPEGIIGNEIRFMTQIVTVADTLDAMSTNRAYRKALSFEDILDELQKGKGTQFNPELAELMVEMLIKKEIRILG